MIRWLGVALVLIATSPAAAQTNTCAVLRGQDFTGIPDAPTAITGAEVIAAENDLPEYCRITGTIAPAISFELRLPTSTWNGKFLMQGCGGMCGIINMEDGEDALVRNYAVVNQNMGHSGQPFIATWAYND